MHRYDETYYRYINTGAMQSATHVLPIVHRLFGIRSVIDFGAGQGAWLSVWRQLGVSDVIGVDGEYVDRSSLFVPSGRFLACDLTKPIRLGRTFDLVQSLEVAEHLPPSAARTFVGNLVAHGPVILFSAAPPGQGGEHHVNERPYDYWRTLFRAHGYIMFDMIRPAVAANRAVEPWYRYNSFLLIHEALLPSLAADIRAYQVPDDAGVIDVSPCLYRLRKRLVSVLPVKVATRVAVLKKHCYTRLASRQGDGQIAARI